jgi:hypothetical protein
VALELIIEVFNIGGGEVKKLIKERKDGPTRADKDARV